MYVLCSYGSDLVEVVNRLVYMPLCWSCQSQAVSTDRMVTMHRASAIKTNKNPFVLLHKRSQDLLLLRSFQKDPVLSFTSICVLMQRLGPSLHPMHQRLDPGGQGIWLVITCC